MFENKAIRCETFDQVKDIARIGKEKLMTVSHLNEDNFSKHEAMFVVKNVFGGSLMLYPRRKLMANETEISYQDFLAQLTPSVDQPDKCSCRGTEVGQFLMIGDCPVHKEHTPSVEQIVASANC